MDSALRSVKHESQRSWEERILRCRELQAQHASAATALRFYDVVLRFQQELAGEFNSAIRPKLSIREQLEPAIVIGKFPKLLALASESGLEPLSHHARVLIEAGEKHWRSILESALTADRAGLNFLDSFFARVCLQPAAENLRLQQPGNEDYGQSICPTCGGLPQLSVLRPEGEGASRWLLCSFCLREWRFRRIACPSCAEQDKEKLPRYSAEGYTYIHVEACDRCKRYLKNVDMTIDGRAVPLVDEAALAVLDVWASDHGYTKIIPNLIGF